MDLQPYSIVVRKDNSGFYKKPSIGSLSMMFLGVSPQNRDLAIVAHTREDVVGEHKGAPIVKLPYSTITLEPLDSLVEAPYEVLVELGIVRKTDA
jgi:hypothetical protein